jgi:hypothetical protein
VDDKHRGINVKSFPQCSRNAVNSDVAMGLHIGYGCLPVPERLAGFRPYPTVSACDSPVLQKANLKNRPLMFAENHAPLVYMTAT